MRQALILAESASAIAVALARHQLTLPYLLVVAVVFGVASPFGGTARMLLVRAVVPDEQLTAALTQEQVREGITQLAGPPLGGFLYGVRQLLPFLFSAVAFAVSLTCALLVGVPARTADRDSRSGGILTGVRTLWRDPTLRAATVLCALLNTVTAPLLLITTVVLRRQAVPPWLIGVALAGFAVGGLLGSVLIGPLHRRWQPGVLLIGFSAVEVPFIAALGVPWGPWWTAAVLLCMGLGLPAVLVLVDVLIFRQVPDEERGRVIAAVGTLFGIGMPVGSGLAGVLLEYLGPTRATVALAAVLAVCAVYSAGRRELRTARWPST